MADKLVPSADDTGAIRLFKDMGDGTWAEVVSTTSTPPVAGPSPAGYPAGATPVQASATAANAPITATLPAAVGKRTYVTGIQVTGGGATAATIVAASITGLLGGQINYSIGVSAVPLATNTPLIVQFNPPLLASALNSAIALSTAAYGAGNTSAQVVIQGFQI